MHKQKSGACRVLLSLGFTAYCLLLLLLTLSTHESISILQFLFREIFGKGFRKFLWMQLHLSNRDGAISRGGCIYCDRGVGERPYPERGIP